jgi:hypothetical protein
MHIGYLPLSGVFFLVGDSPVSCRLSFKDFIVAMFADSSVWSLAPSLSVYFMHHHTLALMSPSDTYDTLYDHYLTEEVFQ